MRVIKFIPSCSLLLVALCTNGQTPGGALWNELKTKRDNLPGFHQEFDVSRTYVTAHGNQGSKYQIIVEASQRRWRERIGSGSSTELRIFDGKDLLRTEEGSDEFVRTKYRPKDEDPMPCPYCAGDPDWQKAVEASRRPCGMTGTDHVCVVLDVPLKKWTRSDSPGDRDHGACDCK